MVTKVCTKCGIEKDKSVFGKHKYGKDGLQPICKACMNAYNKEYRKINHDKEAARSKKYYKTHLEEEATRDKKYKEANRKKIAANQKKYRKENPDKHTACQKKYFQTKAGRAARCKNSHKRRALKIGSTVEDFSPIEIFDRDGYRCQICNRKTSLRYKNPNHPLYTNLDHLIPLSKGGNHSRLNTQVLCHKCNMEKRNREDFGDQLRLFG